MHSLRENNNAYEFLAAIYPSGASHNLPTSLPRRLNLEYDREQLYTFASEAGEVRYYAFPYHVACATWFMKHHLTRPDDALSDLIGTGEFTRISSSPLRYWQVSSDDVLTFASTARLSLPKARCRPCRFGDLARRFARNLRPTYLTLTYERPGSGASSEAHES